MTLVLRGLSVQEHKAVREGKVGRHQCALNFPQLLLTRDGDEDLKRLPGLVTDNISGTQHALDCLILPSQLKKRFRETVWIQVVLEVLDFGACRLYLHDWRLSKELLHVIVHRRHDTATRRS